MQMQSYLGLLFYHPTSYRPPEKKRQTKRHFMTVNQAKQCKPVFLWQTLRFGSISQINENTTKIYFLIQNGSLIGSYSSSLWVFGASGWLHNRQTSLRCLQMKSELNSITHTIKGMLLVSISVWENAVQLQRLFILLCMLKLYRLIIMNGARTHSQTEIHSAEQHYPNLPDSFLLPLTHRETAQRERGREDRSQWKMSRLDVTSNISQTHAVLNWVI